MSPILSMILAASLAAFDPLPAEPGDAAPASEVLLDRFMAALPPSPQAPSVHRTVELEMLAALNPGRVDEIRPILEAEAACEDPLKAEMNARLTRGAAQRLGDEKLGRLIGFYEGEDFGTFGTLTERTGAGPDLSEAEQAELDRILEAYPLIEFAGRMQEAGAALFEDPAMEAIIQCGFDRRAAFERLGLRLYPEE